MLKRFWGLLTATLILLCPMAAAAKEKPASLSSLSAVLYEPESGRFLYEKDADTPRPMASTTKLMTALVASQLLTPDQVVTVPEQAVLVEGSSMGLRGGDRITVRDLLTGLLLSSGNDAANALALLSCGSLPAFAEQMNRQAKLLGMNGSLFVTPSGLDEGGHSATARDMALLGAAVLKNEELARICGMKTAIVQVGDPMHEATLSNHNRLLHLYPDAIGMKTGFTKKAGKCLVSAARRDGVTLIAVTLNGGDYWNDHIALYEYGFSQAVSCPLTPPELSSLPLAGGAVGTVSLTTPAPENAVLLKGEEQQVTCQLRLPSFLWAPAEAGETVGTVIYRVGERVLCEQPVLIAEAVPARPAHTFAERWLQRWLLLLKELIR